MKTPLVSKLFNGIYNNRKVFLTGHTGFKGSWLAYWLKALGAEVTGYSLQAPTVPSHFELLDLEQKSILADINDREKLASALQRAEPEIVFHLAAQPLVRLSYENPIETFETNVIGTLNVYEAVRKTPSVKAIVSITTDKVYENHEKIRRFQEGDPLGGKDPYSASKAAMEILSNSYRHSFFNNGDCLLATARAGNVIGGGDWAVDRLIPDLVKAAHANETTAIRAPEAIRPWQHVLEPLSGYLLLGEKLLNMKSEFATAFNFGPTIEDELTVGEVVEMLGKTWNKISYSNESCRKGLHEATNLRLAIEKAGTELGWAPIWNLQTAIEKTIDWYKSFYEKQIILTEADLNTYIESATLHNASWVS